MLDWSPERVAAEVAGYQARVAAERRAEEAPDDAAADAVRTAVPDSREALATSS